jgi:hypothetical protein
MLTILSREEIADIKDEIKRLEEPLAECNDSGLQKQIEAWTEDQKNKLASSDAERPHNRDTRRN